MKEGGRGARVRKGDVTMEAKARVMQLLVWGHKPRNVGGLWKLRTDLSLQPAKKWKPQSYNHQELNSATIRMNKKMGLP